MSTPPKYPYINCRLFGHTWNADPQAIADYLDNLREEPELGEPDVGLRCLRCEMLRVDWWDFRGDLLRRHYVTPENYKIESILPPTRADWRMAYTEAT